MEKEIIDWSLTRETAIQQLAIALEKGNFLPFDPLSSVGSEVIKLFSEASNTFKNQIIEAYNAGHRGEVLPRGASYYVETYETESIKTNNTIE
jgi:hypothetical protein